MSAREELPSKQVRWQQKQRQLGRCRCLTCGAETAPGATLCARHLATSAWGSRRRTSHRKWRPGGPGRAPIANGLGVNWDTVDFSKPAAELARQLGVTPEAVRYQKRKRKSSHETGRLEDDTTNS